jgi:hypothetical protein
MKRHVVRLATVIVLAAILGRGSFHAQELSTSAARASVDAWLSLIDNQNYAASWDAAASLFRTRITAEQWQMAAAAARTPFGPVKSRTLKSATSTRTLAGAPDGEYVVFQFSTSLEHKAAAVETVTAVREPDGTWHVGGYFIK